MYNRVLRELRKIQFQFHQFDFLHSLRTDGSNVNIWYIKYTSGHNLKLTFTDWYPHEPPIIDFDDDICMDLWDIDWSPTMSGMDVALSIYINADLRQRKLRLMGLLRCIPMMMLWRKRATERIYHPSRIDFSAWVDD